MRRIGVKKQRITGFQSVNFAPVPIAKLSLKHIDRLDPFVLKRGKHIGRFSQRDQVGFNNDTAGVRSDVTQQLVLMASTRAFALHFDTTTRLGMNRAALFFEAT